MHVISDASIAEDMIALRCAKDMNLLLATSRTNLRMYATHERGENFASKMSMYIQHPMLMQLYHGDDLKVAKEYD